MKFLKLRLPDLTSTTARNIPWPRVVSRVPRTGPRISLHVAHYPAAMPGHSRSEYPSRESDLNIGAAHLNHVCRLSNITGCFPSYVSNPQTCQTSQVIGHRVNCVSPRSESSTDPRTRNHGVVLHWVEYEKREKEINVLTRGPSRETESLHGVGRPVLHVSTR
jgi:hypothetical protein